VAELFGDSTAEVDRQGRITVLDVPLTTDAGHEPASEIRDHVRICRDTGAAASGGKFDQEIVHRPVGIIRLIVETDSLDDPSLRLLRCVESALSTGVLAFGGKSGWGIGRASLHDDPERRPVWTISDRGTPEGLSAYLEARFANSSVTAADPPPAVASVGPRCRKPGEPRPWSWLRIGLRLSFDGPFLVAGVDREVVHGPIDAVYFVDPDGKPLLPGSSIRGALHAHADRIAESLGVPHAADALFGFVKGKQAQRGLLSVGNGALAGDTREILLDHVAIDRLTGFAATGRLFDALALASPTFTTEILLRWHPGDAEHERALALLLFTLRDVERGELWVGSRTTRGYGWLKSIDITTVEVSDVETEEAIERRVSYTAAACDVAAIGRLVSDDGRLSPAGRALEAWRSEIERVSV
jgi:CRISPR/Cas system CSM-associated protein Csm3 (group 7 of RAMP superfamily)